MIVTGFADGDLGPRSDCPQELMEARRQSVARGRWRWLSQVHGEGVVVVGAHEECQGREGDALVSTGPGEPVAVFAADCALVGLASPEGLIGAVHGGWRGLLAGVFEQAAGAMRAAGASEISAVVGPCIGPECYEFGELDLEPIVRRYGSAVRSTTRSGRPALDLRAGVHAALEQLRVPIVSEIDECTACGAGWFSWRARRETGRHALVVVPSP